MKRIFIISCIILLVLLSGCSNSELQEDYDTLKSKYDTLVSDYDKLATENADLQEKVKEAEPWFELSEMEKEAEKNRIAAEKAAEEARIAAENAAKAEEKRLAEEKAAAEAEAKAKVGYNTGITFNQLSRTPDDYIGEKVKFSGKVIQVLEGSGTTQLRVATRGNYDDIILVTYSSNIVSSRVLEDDQITLYGLSMGLYTYQSTMGGEITLPLIAVEKIDI